MLFLKSNNAKCFIQLVDVKKQQMKIKSSNKNFNQIKIYYLPYFHSKIIFM